MSADATAAPPTFPEIIKTLETTVTGPAYTTAAKDGTLDVTLGRAVHPQTAALELMFKMGPKAEFKDIKKMREGDLAFAAFGGPVDPYVQREKVTANGVSCEWFWWPSEATTSPTSPVIVYYHGGAYCMGSTVMYEGTMARIAKMADARVLFVDYRKPPESTFADLVDDSFKAYEWLVKDQKVKPAHIGFAGDSAGAGVASIVTRLCIERLFPTPKAVVLLSPFMSLTSNHDQPEAKTDAYLAKDAEAWADLAGIITGPNPPNNKADQPWEVLEHSVEGFPPVYITASRGEILWHHATKLFEKLKTARVAGCVLVSIPSGTHALAPDFGGVLDETHTYNARWTGWLVDAIAPHLVQRT